MPRDLPTRRVFLSRSHFVSFIPLSTATCGLRPRSGRSGDALPRCFFTLGSTTLFMSHSFRWRVGHPARAVFGTLRRKSWNASIHKNKYNYKSEVILFFCEPISSDTIPRGFLAPRYRKEYFRSPTCGTSTIMVHLPCTQNSKGESPRSSRRSNND